MSGTYSYTPGTALALCGPHAAALVDLPADAGLVPGLYDLIGGTGNLDEALELLVTPGLRAVQHFALAAATDEGLRVLVRGRYLVQAGEATIEGRGLWTDRIVPATGFTLVDPDAGDGTALPLAGGGVVLAGRLGTTGARPPAQALAAGDAGAAAAPGAARGQRASTEPGRGTSGRAAGSSPVTAESGGPVATHRSALAAGATLPTPVEAPDTPATTSADSPAGTGHTMNIQFTNPITDLPEPPAAPADGQPSFIDSLPWSVDEPQAETAAMPPVAAEDGASDRTVNRDDLPREGPQLVVAARCPAGHLSPAYAGACRVCGQLLPPQQPVEIPRPPLGVLKLSNGDTVVLDRGCILGRNPRVPSPRTGERPNLVKLMDPDKDISAQHLEVRLEYWHVAVKDLGSTNGTQVVLPGQNPVTLRPNDPLMIEPGTKVVLAGVFSFTFEVTG